jgi:hypothetical protein
MQSNRFLFTAATAVAATLLMPGLAGAAALVLGPSNGILNGGNFSVAVNGNGLTTGCVNFYASASPDACNNVPNTFTVNAPVDTTVFGAVGTTGMIQDIPAPPALITDFMTVPGPLGTVHFDLTSVVVPTQIPCPPATIPGTCAVGDFIFTANTPNSTSVAFTVMARAYTGTSATGFTPYVITFTSPFSDRSITDLIVTVAAGGTITNSVSFTASPVAPPPGPPFNGCSVTQGGWGAPPHGNNPGALLASSFKTVYPMGVSIGDNGGPFTLHFTSAAAIQAFLPQGGTPGALDASAVDPTSSSAGVFAGQVLALQLNVNVEGMGSLVLTGTGTSLDGKTLTQVVAAANTALGGGPLPAGFSFSSLNDLVDNLNNAFDGCVADSFAQTHLK